MTQQLGDVFAALAQRGNLDADHIEPMQQILAEVSGHHAHLEILVRGGDHAHVDLDGGLASHSIEFALGQYAQQARLQRRRHVADLV
jgi:hypothetical protein